MERIHRLTTENNMQEFRFIDQHQTYIIRLYTPTPNMYHLQCSCQQHTCLHLHDALCLPTKQMHHHIPIEDHAAWEYIRTRIQPYIYQQHNPGYQWYTQRPTCTYPAFGPEYDTYQAIYNEHAPLPIRPQHGNYYIPRWNIIPVRYGFITRTQTIPLNPLPGEHYPATITCTSVAPQWMHIECSNCTQYCAHIDAIFYEKETSMIYEHTKLHNALALHIHTHIQRPMGWIPYWWRHHRWRDIHTPTHPYNICLPDGGPIPLYQRIADKYHLSISLTPNKHSIAIAPIIPYAYNFRSDLRIPIWALDDIYRTL